MTNFSQHLRCLVLAASLCFGMVAAETPAQAQPSPDQLTQICINGTVDELAAAINSGADVNALDSQYMAPLMMVAWDHTNSTVEKANLLLKADANLEMEDAFGSTALHYASAECDVKLMKLLIDAGANVNAANSGGATPLNRASLRKPDWEKGRQEAAIKLLLESGATVSANPAWVLVVAAIHGEPGTIKILLDAGCKVNEPNKMGTTPLMAASRSNSDPEVITFLLNAGADVDAKDSKGETALNCAKQNTTPAAGEIIKILQAAK